MFLKRLDKYGGICEEFAAMVNVDFKLCICHSMNAIAEYYPNEVSAIAHKIKPTLSRIANSNCENVCKTHNMECDDTYYDLLNYCSQVKNLVDEEELEVAQVTCQKDSDWIGVRKDGAQGSLTLLVNE